MVDWFAMAWRREDDARSVTSRASFKRRIELCVTDESAQVLGESHVRRKTRLYMCATLSRMLRNKRASHAKAMQLADTLAGMPMR